MSKKKKNIRRKKSNNLLKGMAAAGAVVGGGTIFAGNNAVYAAENEQGVIQSEEQIIESQSVSESTTESLSQAKSETSSFESEVSAATSAVEGNTVQTNQKAFVKRAPRFFNNVQAQSSDEQNIMLADETGNEKVVNENGAEQEAASLSVSGSVSGSISEVGSQISSESISGSEAESEMVSESSSISTSTENFKSESERLSTSSSLSTSTETSTYTSESESLSKEFTSASEAFESQKNQTLEDLITNINNTKQELEKIRQTAIKNNNTTLGEAYRLKADDLAKYLAQYNFYQKYGDGKITNTNTKFNNNGIGGSYDRNNTYLEYTTQGPQGSVKHTGYFDWIAVTEKKDSFGNLILDKDGKVQYKRVEYNQVPASEVAQIVVLKKAPIYSNPGNVDSYGNKESFYYYEDEFGKHFFLTEKETTNDVDHTEGSWWNPVYKTKYEYKALDSAKVQINSENGDEIEFKYNGITYKFSVLKESNGDHYYPYFGEVPDKLDSDEDGSTNDTVDCQII